MALFKCKECRIYFFEFIIAEDQLNLVKCPHCKKKLGDEDGAVSHVDLPASMLQRRLFIFTCRNCGEVFAKDCSQVKNRHAIKVDCPSCGSYWVSIID